MSLKSLTNIHAFEHWRETTTRGAGGGQKKVPAKLKDIRGRYQPYNEFESSQLQKEGRNITGRVFFSGNPSVKETDELRYVDLNGDTLKLRCGITRNVDHLNRLFVVEVKEFRDIENI